jgi:hypothetical protein
MDPIKLRTILNCNIVANISHKIILYFFLYCLILNIIIIYVLYMFKTNQPKENNMSRKTKKQLLNDSYRLFDDQSRYVLFQSILKHLKDDDLDRAIISKNEINEIVVKKQVAEIEKQLDCKVNFTYQRTNN